MNTCGWEIFGRNVLVEMPYLISLNPLFSKKNIEHVGRLKHLFCLCLCMCLRFVFFITRCHVNVIFENLENPALREKKNIAYIEPVRQIFERVSLVRLESESYHQSCIKKGPSRPRQLSGSGVPGDSTDSYGQTCGTMYQVHVCLFMKLAYFLFDINKPLYFVIIFVFSHVFVLIRFQKMYGLFVWSKSNRHTLQWRKGRMSRL